MELKHIIAAIVLVLVLSGTVMFFSHTNNGEVVKSDEVAKLKEQIQKLESDNIALADEIKKDPTTEAAKLGFTENPGWQLQRIIEKGGDGSVFYQVHATTVKDGRATSTVGPLGFSWQSTTDDALKALAEQRGEAKKK